MSAENRFHFWIKAFVPNEHPSIPDYFFRSNAGTWVFRAPPVPGELNGTCFETDNRSFSDSPEASARVTSEFVLVMDGAKVRVERAGPRALKRLGKAKNVDCGTGRTLRTPIAASADQVELRWTTRTDALTIISTRASIANPYYGLLGFNAAPKIDYDVRLEIDASQRKLTMTISAGTFPAFEAYYRLNGGPAETIISWSAEETVVSLLDLGSRINTRTQRGFVNLPRTSSEQEP